MANSCPCHFFFFFFFPYIFFFFFRIFHWLIISQEARQKAKAEQTLDIQVKTEDIIPTPLEEPRPSKAQRRKSIDKKLTKENTYSKLVEERRLKHEYAAKKPPERPPNPPLRLPALPTAPIPVSELPPDSVRTPPKQIPKIIPALSGLTPIPLKDLNSVAHTSVASASPTAPESISIQVTIKKTKNIPNRLLSG